MFCRKVGVDMHVDSAIVIVVGDGVGVLLSLLVVFVSGASACGGGMSDGTNTIILAGYC